MMDARYVSFSRACERCGATPLYTVGKREMVCFMCLPIVEAEALAEVRRRDDMPQIFDLPALDA